MDRFSPLAPARVRVLLLPIWLIERQTFDQVYKELAENASIIPLRDLSSKEDNNHALSPLKSPQGCILLNYTTSDTDENLQKLSPFEFWRETLLVIGVAVHSGKDDSLLSKAAAELRDRHSRVVYRHILVLDSNVDQTTTHGEVTVVKLQQQLDLLPAVADIMNRFLQEFATYLTAMQASPSIQTPGQTSQGLLQAMLSRGEDGRPDSRQGTPLGARSPSIDENGSRPASQDVPLPPPTTFDQIPAANTLGRSDSSTSRRSKSHSRALSFERVPVHNLSKEKLRDRGKARVGVVTGSMYMMAGQWPEALKLLVDSTTRLRSLNDHIWNGKGLELIVVCVILHLWIGIDVQVPAICFQLSGKVRDRLSKAFAADLAQKLVSPQTPLERLSSSLHDLSKHVLLLYHSVEDNMELPYVVVAEATIRFCKILACQQASNGQLTERSIQWMAEHDSSFTTSTSWSSSTFQTNKPLTKAGISDMLANALPPSDESISLAEHINVLTGIASVYAILNMERKKAITLKALVARLTVALDQARKLGAAEMGMHPAATLSAENGNDALLSTVQGSTGLTELARSLAAAYGVDIGIDTRHNSHFGSKTLQIEILRELLKLCEASPDLKGISRLVVAFMTTIGQHEAVDLTAGSRPLAVSAEEQTRLLGMFSKATWLLKQLDLDAEDVSYWDPFILRSIEVVSLVQEKIIQESVVIGKQTQGASANNPLLYDPNAPIHKTTEQKVILAQGEPAQFRVSLQNPFDVPIDIEQMFLVSEGVELSCGTSNIRLRPGSVDAVVLDAKPMVIGQTTLTGCRIKIAGCREQVFPLTTQPWKANALPTNKSIGLAAAQVQMAAGPALPSGGSVAVDIVEPQPQLVTLNDEAEHAPMLLEGETRVYSPTFRNISQVSVTILQLICHTENIKTSVDLQSSTIPPGASFTPDFEINGDPRFSAARASIIYGTSDSTNLSRIHNVQPKLSIKPGLRIVHVDVDKGEDDRLVATLDLFNYWQQPISYRCTTDAESAIISTGVLSNGEVTRIQLKLKRSEQSQKTDMATIQADFLKRLQVSWSSAGRSGMAMLKDIALSQRALLLLKQPPVSIALVLAEANAKNEVVVGEFATIRASITVMSQVVGPHLVRLRQRVGQSAASGQQAALTGSLSRVVPTLSAEQPTSVDFTICPLLTGTVIVEAVIAPAQAVTTDTQTETTIAGALRLSVVE